MGQVFITSTNQQVLLHPSSSVQAHLASAVASVDGRGAAACELYCFMKVQQQRVAVSVCGAAPIPPPQNPPPPQVLETRKPYLTGVFVCAGVQTMLLLGRRVEVSADWRAVLVDNWALMHFHTGAAAQSVWSPSHAHSHPHPHTHKRNVRPV